MSIKEKLMVKSLIYLAPSTNKETKTIVRTQSEGFKVSMRRSRGWIMRKNGPFRRERGGTMHPFVVSLWETVSA